MDVPGQWLVDWGGAQRWFESDAAAGDIRRAVEAAGGYATLFRGGDRQGEVFHPLPPALHALHRRLKQAFDPRRILNPRSSLFGPVATPLTRKAGQYDK